LVFGSIARQRELTQINEWLDVPALLISANFINDCQEEFRIAFPREEDGFVNLAYI
jgi:hypothetical protein